MVAILLDPVGTTGYLLCCMENHPAFSFDNVHPMKRLLLILLLIMMPLQAVWAAGAPYCGHDETTVHPGHHMHKHAPSASQDDDAPAVQCDDCDACHHLSASALPSAHPDAPLPKGAKHLLGEIRRYVSHIPDLIPPPDRAARA